LETVDKNLAESTEILNFFRKQNAQINLEEKELDETFKGNMDELKAKFEHDKKTMESSKAQEQAQLASRKMVATANEVHHKKGVRKWSNQKKHADNELQFLEWIQLTETGRKVYCDCPLEVMREDMEIPAKFAVGMLSRARCIELLHRAENLGLDGHPEFIALWG
jgi:hypothetical protein